MHAVAGELCGCDVAAQVARFRPFGQQVLDQLAQMLLRPVDVLTTMHEHRKFAAVVLVRDQRERLEYCLEPGAGIAGLVADLRELLQVRAGMPRWVKIFGTVAIVLILAMITIMLTGTDHGPSRHSPKDADDTMRTSPGSHTPPKNGHGPG